MVTPQQGALCTAELRGDHGSPAFPPSPHAATRVPCSSQPTACLSIPIIQLGGGDGQGQVLDCKKPRSICSRLLKTEFFMSWNLSSSSKRLQRPVRGTPAESVASPVEAGLDASTARSGGPCSGWGSRQTPAEGEDEGPGSGSSRTAAAAAGSAGPGWPHPAVISVGFRSSCQLKHTPLGLPARRAGLQAKGAGAH